MTSKETKEFIIMKEDVTHIKEDIKVIKDNSDRQATNSDELNKSMTLIKSSLFKNELTGEEGFFETGRRNGVKLNSMEKRYVVSLGIVAGVFMYIGYLIRTFKQ